MEFTNLSSLMKHLESQILDMLKKIGDEVKSALKQELNAQWYLHRPSTDYYDRTMELLESITCSPVSGGNGEYSVKIYYDTDKINPYPSIDGMWSKHESIVDGTPSNEMLPLWIEYGESSPLYSFEGVHPVEYVKDWLTTDKYLMVRFKELLTAKGYQVI